MTRLNGTSSPGGPVGTAVQYTEAAALTDLAAGARGVIVRIDESDHAMLIRLKTMGMHEGRAVRVVRRGSRVIVSCGGTRIGLSAEVARHVLVVPTQAPSTQDVTHPHHAKSTPSS
ncbi:MAG: FeoA family protein [Phycisphaeraceae bacterium]